MTAVIHHGPPGSYKTFALVQRVIIPALQAGRVVCHNIRGLNSIPRICEAMGIEVPETAKLITVQHDSVEGFEYMARFFHWAPPGALIVMDEGQRVYPTRLRSLSEFDLPEPETFENGVQRPLTLENAFDQHRHMNWDIYISTTNVAKIHKEIRSVVEYAFRHRDLSGILPWLNNCWNEFKHDAEQSGKSVSHYIGTPRRYKSDPRVFGCYQSTATGEAKSSNENKSVFVDPKLRFFLGIIVLSISMFIYNLSNIADRYIESPESAIQSNIQNGGLLPDFGLGQSDISGINSNNNDVEIPRYIPTDVKTYFKLTNSQFHGQTVYEYPRSKEWKLTGVIKSNNNGVALITNGNNTLKLSIKRQCAFDGEINEWLCYFDGEVVGYFTGKVQKEETKTQTIEPALLNPVKTGEEIKAVL